jgi:hypothetical protein
MSSVSDLGTIRNTIRGVDEPHPHTLICEMIDDGEHSNSKRVFVDINTHDRTVVFGFENEATEDQLTKMVEWNPVSYNHGSSKISTCGQGLKFYEFRFRGEQIHVTKTVDNSGKALYKKTKLNSDVIYKAASDPDVSETRFSEILKKNTHYLENIDSDEIGASIESIFNNDDDKYPFSPKTIVVSKKITNSKLIDWLNETNTDGININIINLEKEMTNKYFDEIKKGLLTVYIKFPKDAAFRKLGENTHTDIIGTTLNHTDEHIIDIFQVEKDFEQTKKGEYLIRINNIFFNIKKSGNSVVRIL